MKIRNFTLNFVALGKEKKTYLRYYCTNNGKGESYNMHCDVVLTADQLKQLNDGTLGTLIQKTLYKMRNEKEQGIMRFYYANNSYPSAAELKIWDKSVFSTFNIDWYINQYLQKVKAKPSSRRVYDYALKRFKSYYVSALLGHAVEDIIRKKTINDFGYVLKLSAKKGSRTCTQAHIHNYQSIALRFLNFVAEQLNLPKIEFFLELPKYSGKWHIEEADVERLLKHKPTTKTEVVVLDIIRINMLIGLRIGEILTILKDNVRIEPDAVYIRFAEHKNTKERTIVIIDIDVINIIKKYVNKGTGRYLWTFQRHNWFNVVLRNISMAVFEQETVNVYKNTVAVTDYIPVLKYNAISSHSFRRYAIERNIVKYGIDVARTMSGHSDTAIVFKHYAGWMNEIDLKNKLLGK
jgi:integrase